MSIARVRVEAKHYNPNAGADERERNFKGLLQVFRKEVQRSGLMRDIKQHQEYEKPGEKKRRKMCESKVNVLKNKLRDTFTETKKREYE